MIPPDSQGNRQVSSRLSQGRRLAHLAGERRHGPDRRRHVATFTDSAKHAVGLKVTFGAFPDERCIRRRTTSR